MEEAEGDAMEEAERWEAEGDAMEEAEAATCTSTTTHSCIVKSNYHHIISNNHVRNNNANAARTDGVGSQILSVTLAVSRSNVPECKSILFVLCARSGVNIIIGRKKIFSAMRSTLLNIRAATMYKYSCACSFRCVRKWNHARAVAQSSR